MDKVRNKNQQLRYYYGKVLKDITNCFWETQGFFDDENKPITYESVHNWLKLQFLFDIVICDEGEIIRDIMSLGLITTHQLTEYIDKVRQFSLANFDFYIDDSEVNYKLIGINI